MTILPSLPEVTRFRELISELLGLHFDESKLSNLAKLLHLRVLAKSEEYTPYLNHLASCNRSADELFCIAAELTITETYFLRNRDQFHAYTDVALPERLAADEGQRIVRVLSAGCASGEEPYSLALLAREHYSYALNRIAIIALDVNPVVLEKAAHARYTNWSLRDFPAELKARWFTQENNHFVLDDTIRHMVKFEQRNLACEALDFWQPSSLDIVFCRNVLMYFTPEQAQAVITRIARALVPGGYFFLGHAETLRGLSDDFHLCHTHGTFYYQRKESLSASPVPDLAMPWRPNVALGNTGWVEAIQHATDRIQALSLPVAKVTEKTGVARITAMEEMALATDQVSTLRTAPNLHRALEYLHHERYDQTLEQLGTLPAEQASDPDVLLLKAVSLSHSGALDAADTACRTLLAQDELNAGAHYVLALCREGVGDLQGALEHNQTAIYLDPSFAMPRLHLGLLARRQGDAKLARRELELALSLLQKEDASRLLLFGGGFRREALITLCRAELTTLGENT